MKKRIIFASLIGLLVLGTSCEDNRDEYLSDYDTRMYFRNSDLQEQDCYVTGETTAYTVSVIKAGSDLGAVSDASVSLMEAAQLQIYNEDNVTNYSVLPSNCYTLNGELNMSFASSDSYQTFDVVFDPEAVHNLPTANYVVPFVLNSSKTVNENKNVLFVKPNAIVPTIYFEKSGFSATSLSKTVLIRWNWIYRLLFRWLTNGTSIVRLKWTRSCWILIMQNMALITSCYRRQPIL